MPSRKTSNRKTSNQKTSNRKTTNQKTKQNKKKKNICWKGYHRVKGTAPYTKKSCAKDL